MNVAKYLSKNKKFINGILITMLIGVVVNLLNYFFTVFLARNVDDINFGFYNAALGIITLAQIPTIAIQTALTKKVAKNKDINLTKFKNRSTLQLLAISLVISLIFYLLGDYIADMANIPEIYILPLTLVVFGAILTPVLKGFLLGLEKILAFNLILLVETVLKFVIGGIGIYYSTDMSLPILAFVLPSIVIFILLYPFIGKKEDKEKPKTISLDYKDISLTFITFFLLTIPFTLDLILVNPNVRASYGALSLIGKIVFFASVTIATVMISKLANSKEKQKKKNLTLSLLVSTATGIAISFLFLLFDKEIVGIVFDGKYQEIIPYIVPYSIAITGYAISYMVITSLLVNNSYVHIYFLLSITVIQSFLFNLNNSSLYDAYINQILIFSLLFITSLFILIFYIFKSDGRKKSK